VHLTGCGLGLGSTASLEAILKSPIGRTPAGALIQEACRTTAHSVLRAVVSVGGVVGCGEPSDLLLVLLAVDAMCIARGTLLREVPLAGFSPDVGELLLEVRVPLPGGNAGAALERVARTPRDRSIVAAAALLELDGTVCVRARLALSGVAPRATRWRTAEALLEGHPLTAERIAGAAAMVEAETHPPSDHLGGADYRRAMGAVLARRALTAAWQRATREATSQGS
jgi:carbon-monoxide dehydrogenase medium subunit